MVDDAISALLLGMIVVAAVLRVRQKRKDRRVPAPPSDDGPQLY
ncbi:MAG: hypothetical protein AAGC46_07540 [Solirubrobacteraceae bacterium]|nr:hypothetical protein [Patulibacter sp.]